MAEQGSARAPGGPRFTPAGIVTLLTDFGTRDPFVGAMKGRLLGACPQIRIVDLTHELESYRPALAGFWLERLRRDFPCGTVHVAIVDPGVGTARRLLALLLEGQVLLAPDNGLLGNLAGIPGAEVRAVGAPLLEHLSPNPSATFHGRDLFAPLAGLLASGRLAFEELGNEIDDPVPSEFPRPATSSGLIGGQVVLVDKYGNLFSNIESISRELITCWSVRFGDHELPCVQTYGDAPRGTCIALVNAFGVVEAACVEGNASQILDLRPGAPVVAVHRPDGGG